MILLDTHAWLWAVNSPEKLSSAARMEIMQTPFENRWISSISFWEFAMAVFKNKIALNVSPDTWMESTVTTAGLSIADLSIKIAVESCNLPGDFHKDPADRIIVATSRVLGMPLITKDEKILNYKHVETIW